MLPKTRRRKRPTTKTPTVETEKTILRAKASDVGETEKETYLHALKEPFCVSLVNDPNNNRPFTIIRDKALQEQGQVFDSEIDPEHPADKKKGNYANVGEIKIARSKLDGMDIEAFFTLYGLSSDNYARKEDDDYFIFSLKSKARNSELGESFVMEEGVEIRPTITKRTKKQEKELTEKTNLLKQRLEEGYTVASLEFPKTNFPDSKDIFSWIAENNINMDKTSYEYGEDSVLIARSKDFDLQIQNDEGIIFGLLKSKENAEGDKETQNTILREKSLLSDNPEMANLLDQYLYTEHGIGWYNFENMTADRNNDDRIWNAYWSLCNVVENVLFYNTLDYTTKTLLIDHTLEQFSSYVKNFFQQMMQIQESVADSNKMITLMKSRFEQATQRNREDKTMALEDYSTEELEAALLKAKKQEEILEEILATRNKEEGAESTTTEEAGTQETTTKQEDTQEAANNDAGESTSGSEAVTQAQLANVMESFGDKLVAALTANNATNTAQQETVVTRHKQNAVIDNKVQQEEPPKPRLPLPRPGINC